MPYDFLTPRIDRLDASGQVHPVHPGTGLGRALRRPVLLLGRDLCSFNLFAAAKLPRSRRAQAAHLYARTSAPFLQSGSLVLKSGEDFAVWWWDQAKVESLTAKAGLKPQAASLCPESLSQPQAVSKDEVWRIVRLANGYEAQAWKNRILLASAWRPETYSPSAWQGFVRLQRHLSAAPATPPAPSVLPLAFNPGLPLNRTELSRQQIALMAAGGFATVCLGLSLFILGQSWSTNRATEALAAETQLVRDRTPRPADVEGLGDAQKRLVAYQELEARTNPLSSAGAAIGILAYHDIVPIKVSSETGKLEIVLHYGLLNRLDKLIPDLETAGYFSDIRPRSDTASQTITIVMAVKDSAPPLEAL